MKAQYKLAIALAPFIGVAVVASACLLPTWQEDQEKRGELTNKRQENDRLVAKLRDRAKAEQEKQSLESEIEALRGAVPKSPDLDLFLIDLDKLCAESGLDLVAIEDPQPETVKQIETSEEEVKRLLAESEGKVTMGSKTPERTEAAPNQQAQKKAKEKESVGGVAGLRQLLKQVYVTGTYEGMVKLMHSLESYQRVTGVRQVAVSLQVDSFNTRNPAGDRAQKLGLNQPIMSFLMILYYLP